MAWIDDIKDKVIRRVPELGEEANEDLLEDLIEDAFCSIVSFSNAVRYKKEWDSVLVRSVAMLYNGIGTEGIVVRSSLGTTDYFHSTDIIAEYLTATIPQYIRSSSFVYPEDRYDYPN